MDYIGKSQFMRGVLSLVGFVAPLVTIHSLPAAIIGMAFCCMLVTLFYDLPTQDDLGISSPASLTNILSNSEKHVLCRQSPIS